MKRSLLADFTLLLVAFIWGTTFLIVQNAVQALPPLAFNGIRFTGAALLFALILILVHRGWWKQFNMRLLRHGIILGILVFGGFAFQTYGLLYTTSSNAGFITGLSVVLVPFFSVWILRQRLRWPAWASAALALIGLFLLSTSGSSTFHMNLGDILVLACALCFALQIIATGKYAPHHPTLPLVTIQLGTVGVLGLVGSVLFENIGSFSDWMHLTMQTDVLIALAITLLFGTAFAFWAQTYCQKYTSPTRVAIIFAMEPVFAGITGYVWGDEQLGIAAIIGCGLMLISMLIVELKPTEQAPSPVTIDKASP
ncbi:EamA family transporter [Paenibacillus selenitireducens]|uniref:EamA family transporter n=1 Tax=Paenibacillus selenitireducens TaxID=1324314 RepID=A0A1T2XAN7_9BACL|nr:DMT family transporter [Paenibacillus selenitireducens]OPA76908.1 EamA family transporter [Paenibacillus selenitireducens]